MSHHRIPDHLGLCEVDGRLLMLDLRRDRYFELDPGGAAALRSWRKSSERLDADPNLDRLVERGILVLADRPDISGWVERRPPSRSLLDDNRHVAHSAWKLVPEIGATLWAARRRLRQGLEGAARHARQSNIGSAAGDACPLLARFRAARRLVPVAPTCLADSLALAAYLARRGIACELIFGVKLDPFAAHCWLESDGAVLNDSADSIAAFTPIMAV